MADSRPKAVVTDHSFPDVQQERESVTRFRARFETYQSASETEVAEAVNGAKVVLAQLAPVSRWALEVMGAGGIVVCYSVGVDNIDLAAGRRVRQGRDIQL
ncbi:MAG: hypothetical protein WD314_07620 [Trueperaceae bacterium]